MKGARKNSREEEGSYKRMKQGRSGEQGLSGMEGKEVMKKNDRSRDKAERKKEGI